MEIKRDGFTVLLEEPTLYVDNKSRHRSGHMSHAMAEFDEGKFIDFNANCSAVRWDGHSTYGWIEYRISEDAGKTYSDIYKLPYAWESFLDGIYTISVEKAVACDDGTIVAFCLTNWASGYSCCCPWGTSMVVRSMDGGKTWTEPYEFCEHKGRIYDSLYRDGVIYTLIVCNENWGGSTPDHLFRLYKSVDNGATFEELSVIPIPFERRGYGALLFDTKGDLHAYALNGGALCDLDHAISYDNGQTWELTPTIHFDKGMNNPQVGLIDGVYIMHGRSFKVDGYVLYTSTDAVNWDEGTYIADKAGLCYYSNHINLKDEEGNNFLLLQYSEVYGDNADNDIADIAHNIFSGIKVERLGKQQVNVMHRILRIKKD